MKKRKIIFIKLVILFLGFSVTLFSCEPEILDVNISTENQTDSVLEDFQSQFNKKGFEKTIPYDYKVDWSNTTKQYSEELSVNFFEFDLIYNDVFNPHSTNKSNKRKYNIAYKLIVLENQEKTYAFYIAKFFQEKEGGIAIENLHPKLNNNFGYKGLTHLYDIEGELVFAKYITKDENDNSDIYIDRKLRQREENIAEKYIEVCDTVRTHHYIDWYYHQYDLEGNLVSVTYSHTTYAGYTDKKNCYTKWVPDNGDGGLYGTGVGCDEFGECISDIKEALIEEYISNSLTLTDEQSQWFNDWQNRQAKESIENYLKQYVGSTSEFENAIEFAIEAIEFLIINIQYNFEQYENWFSPFNAELETNPTVVNPDYITFDTPLTQQALPTFSTFLANFPKRGTSGNYSPMSTTDAYTLAGGSLLNSHINQNAQYNNACAIRASRGLLYSGIQIPVLKYNGLQRTQKGADSKNYILDAVSFNTYMIAKFGETSAKLEGADANDPVKVAALLNGKNGIYVIVNSNTTSASYSGHCDVIINGYCISGAYTAGIPGGIKSIRIWELN